MWPPNAAPSLDTDRLTDRWTNWEQTEHAKDKCSRFLKNVSRKTFCFISILSQNTHHLIFCETTYFLPYFPFNSASLKCGHIYFGWPVILSLDEGFINESATQWWAIVTGLDSHNWKLCFHRQHSSHKTRHDAWREKKGVRWLETIWRIHALGSIKPTNNPP